MLQPNRPFQIALSTLILALGLFAGGGQAQDVVPATAGKVSTGDVLVYVGTYTNGQSKGIYLYKLTRSDSQASQALTLAPLGLVAEVASPSFLEIDPDRRLLFAVNETGDFGGRRTGAVSAYSIDPAKGQLTLLNQQPSMGSGPCHLVLDRGRRHVLVANYGSGNVAVLPVTTDGRLGEASDVEQHAGRSVNPRRQEGPHAHCVTFDPAGRYLFVCDLGLDKVMIYRYDAEQGQLTPNEPAFASLKPGAGPRHMAFRPDGEFAYVINELDSTITAFAYDAQAGKLTEVQTVSTLPRDFDGSNTTAEIAVHPSGRFVYGSNRGRDSIALFRIDDASGMLTYVRDQSTDGKTPRHFELDRDGKHLIIANQNTDTLLVCRIDADTGQLNPSGEHVAAPTPVCVKYLEPAKRRSPD
jgi:6-phosphogluconolactonase